LAALNRRIEYSYPLWDIDLIEFYYSLPSNIKAKKGIKRYIFREAMRDKIPEKIRNRYFKSSSTIPTVHQRFLKDYNAILSLIKIARKETKAQYLDYNKLFSWAERIKNRGFSDKIPANPGAFFNSLQILLWQLNEKELFND
jgi:asparagine synthase (glutamine-hydrolysing)